MEHQHLWRKIQMTFHLPQLWYYGLSESFLSIYKVLVLSRRQGVWQEDFCAKLGQKLLKSLGIQRGFLSRPLEFCSRCEWHRLRCRLWTDIVRIHIAYLFIYLFYLNGTSPFTFKVYKQVIFFLFFFFFVWP